MGFPRVYLKSRKFSLFLQAQLDFALNSLEIHKGFLRLFALNPACACETFVIFFVFRYTLHPLYCIHLYFNGFYHKMQARTQHFCHFPVFSANVFTPGCINAIQFLQYPLQTLFESKPFAVTALPVKMRLPRSAERGNREI